MTDLVEAVARALCEAHIRNVRRHDTAPEELEAMMAKAVNWSWKDFVPQAGVVIPVVLERLREPTPAMLDAFVSRALQVSIDGEGGWSNYGRNQWQAILDAAIRGLE